MSLRNQEIWIFVPSGAASSMRIYKETGAQVLPAITTSQQAEFGRCPGTKVRAVLQPDAHGIVKMAEHWAGCPADPQAFDEPQGFPCRILATGTRPDILCSLLQSFGSTTTSDR